MKTRVVSWFDTRFGIQMYQPQAFRPFWISGHFEGAAPETAGGWVEGRWSTPNKDWTNIGFLTPDKEKAVNVAWRVANGALSDTQSLEVVSEFGVDE